MPVVDVRDTKLYYETVGQGEPTLLFIHGACGGGWDWEEQISRLSDRFTCITYDRRGHSRSEPGTDDQSNDTHIEDAAALIEALGLDRPVLVGDSSGAEIAIDVMRRYPELVRGGALSEPVLFSLDPEGGDQLIEQVSRSLEQAVEDGGPDAAVDAFFEAVCPQFWAQTGQEHRRKLRENAPMLFAMLESEPTTMTPDDLAGIDHPVLIISGSLSVPVIRRVSKIAADYLPNARFIEIAGSGHVTHTEKPDDFASAVTAFVGEIRGPVPSTR